MSFLMNNSNMESIDSFGINSPVECYKLKYISIYGIFVFVFGVLFNSILLWTLIYFKELRNSMNSFMTALSIFNLTGSLLELPFIITSNFMCRWPFKRIGCVLTGFLMYFIGCTSIYLMAAISFQRFYIIYKPLSIKSLDYKFSLFSILICIVIGAFWSGMPLVGWSYYSLEGALTSCSVEWSDRSTNVISYNITIFGFVYFLPLLAIFISNIKLVLMIRNMPKFNTGNSAQNYKLSKKFALEKELTISTLIIIIGFLISWTPYALVCMYSAFINSNKLNPFYATVPSMFAKTSLVWSSAIYLFTNKKILNQFKKSFFKIDESKSLSQTQSQTKKSETIEIQNTITKAVA